MSGSGSASDDRRCPSDLVLDRYLVGELDEAARRELETHAAACEACRGLLEARREEVRRFAEAPSLPSRAVATLGRLEQERARRGSRVRALLLGGLAAAAVASLLAVLVLRGDLLRPGGEGRDVLRLKGSFALSAFVKRGENVEAARSGERFHPGDALRFEYSATTAGHLAIVSLDAKQVVSLYYPVASARTAPAPAGSKLLLPGSTILDETLGEETVIGVHCPRPFELATLRARLPALLAALRAGRPHGALLPEPGCRTARFELRKERAR
jgi:hypothetical protein